MKKGMKQDTRLGIRLPSDLREEAEVQIRNGQYKSLSDLIRAALKEFLSRQNQEMIK